MARVKIPVVVLGPDGRPLEGASVLIRVRATSADAAVYANESGGGTVSSTRTSDANGRVTGWVGRGGYAAVVSHESMATYTEEFDAAPAVDGSVDEPWMGAQSVDAASLVNALRPSQGATDVAEALRALGTGAGQALPGTHASVTNARTPTAHAASHKHGGSDALYRSLTVNVNTDGAGNGSSGAVAHGLGATPSNAIPVCTSHATLTVPHVTWDAANLTISFPSGAGSGYPSATITFKVTVLP